MLERTMQRKRRSRKRCWSLFDKGIRGWRGAVEKRGVRAAGDAAGDMDHSGPNNKADWSFI